jgi:hypothetical protein
MTATVSAMQKILTNIARCRRWGEFIQEAFLLFGYTAS